MEKKHFFTFFVVACAACIITFASTPADIQRALAFDIPAPDGYVTDLADVFTAEQETGLEIRIGQIEKNTTAEIGILAIKTTGGEDISQVAFDTGNKWGVGKKENDNGLIIVVAIDDRAWFIATGYGIEGAIPDAIAKRIGERDFPIYFKSGDYTSGLLLALNDIESYILKDPSVVASYNYEPEPETETDFDTSTRQELIFMALIFVAVFKSVFLIFLKRKYLYMAIADVAVVAAGFIFATPLFALILIPICLLFDFIAIIAAKDAGRGGGYSNGSSSDSSWSSGSSSWGSSDSGGGSSDSSGGSFGGGSFGGGGAGGKW
jgi:uncharacterized protein